jgi:FkbH-like protein
MTLIDMPWLPAAPAEFRKLCKEIESGTGLLNLANHALDLNDLTTLSKTIGRRRSQGDNLSPLVPFRLGLLGNGTMDLMAPALVATAARHGILLDIVEAPYDQAMQTALDASSDINDASTDAVLLAFDHRIVTPPDVMSDEAESRASVDNALGRIFAIRDALIAASGATVIVQTLAHPPAQVLGNYDRRLPGSPSALVDSFNARLIEGLVGSITVLLDAGVLAAEVGLDSWHDAKLWHIAKLPFSQAAVPLYADHVVRLLGAMMGKSRKCLVLDLDNTLWGGVIGDDGLSGIVIGQGDAEGEAYLDIQRTALQLRSLGIILAVSSKNTDAAAREPFRTHPDMLLRESDIAVFQANWSDKATNLEAIATALDIGIDSLVLLDDNPAERAQVRAALPMVAVPELPDDPAQFPRVLLAAGYFESIGLSEDDLLRADDYTARTRRIELQGQARDMGSYLKSLEMKIVFASFNDTGRGRIAQLINKSNQFNLTTRRYTESDVEAMEADPEVFTLQVRLRDRFGDNGMICVVICRTGSKRWEIDTWIMSCRVLGRRVEEAVLAKLVKAAKAAGVSGLRGQYIPTPRNDLVRDHYRKLGFEEEAASGWWYMDVGAYSEVVLPIHVSDVTAGGTE